MRTRFVVLAGLCALVTAVTPAASLAAPHHNEGLTINVTPNPILAGEAVLIYGQLNGAGNAGQTIYLYHRVNPRAHFTIIQKTTTSSTGFYEFSRPDGIVQSNRSWFVRGPNQTHSRTVHERVAALVSLAASDATTNTHRPVVFSGHVNPNHRFQRVFLQEQNSLSGNGWRTIAKTFTGGGSNFRVPRRFRQPGVYTLRAVFRGDFRNIRGESDSVTLTVQQAQRPGFTIASSSPTVIAGQPVTISGVLDQAGTSTPEPATQVTLFGRQATGGLTALATTVTAADGSYSFVQTPIHNEIYQVRTTLKPRRRTAKLYEGAQDIVTIVPSSMTGVVGGTVTLTGTVTPDKTGRAIFLQRQGADGAWHNVALGVVASGSTYSFTYTLGQTGSTVLRTRIYGGPDNVGAASAAVTISVMGVASPPSLPPAS